MYYLRTKSAVDAIKFTVDQKAVDQKASSEVHKCDPKPDENDISPLEVSAKSKCSIAA